MGLKEYFENAKGLGVLSTADSEGKVDSAVYSRPHIFDDGTVGFIMRDRLSHHNLKSNPRASYLFKEDGDEYKGKRFFLTKIREEAESDLLRKLHRKCTAPEDEAGKGPKFLVFFKLDKELPLIGPGSGN